MKNSSIDYIYSDSYRKTITQNKDDPEKFDIIKLLDSLNSNGYFESFELNLNSHERTGYYILNIRAKHNHIPNYVLTTITLTPTLLRLNPAILASHLIDLLWSER